MITQRYYVYIVSNIKRTVVYIGVTRDLTQRIEQHKAKLVSGFTKKYNCTDLVYFEESDDIYSAISREKQLKGWKRIKKTR